MPTSQLSQFNCAPLPPDQKIKNLTWKKNCLYSSINCNLELWSRILQNLSFLSNPCLFGHFTESSALNGRPSSGVQNSSREEIPLHLVPLWNVQGMLGLAHSRGNVLCCRCCTIQCSLCQDGSHDNGLRRYSGGSFYCR